MIKSAGCCIWSIKAGHAELELHSTCLVHNLVCLKVYILALDNDVHVTTCSTRLQNEIKIGGLTWSCRFGVTSKMVLSNRHLLAASMIKLSEKAIPDSPKSCMPRIMAICKVGAWEFDERDLSVSYCTNLDLSYRITQWLRSRSSCSTEQRSFHILSYRTDFAAVLRRFWPLGSHCYWNQAQTMTTAWRGVSQVDEI